MPPFESSHETRCSVACGQVLGEALVRNLALCHYDTPTPVQKYSLPIGLARRDMMACAQTGSGKTAGFLFPVLVSMLRDGHPALQDGDGGGGSRQQLPMALVLSPTRELTVQIHAEALKFCYRTGVRCHVIYGALASVARTRSKQEASIKQRSHMLCKVEPAPWRGAQTGCACRLAHPRRRGRPGAAAGAGARLRPAGGDPGEARRLHRARPCLARLHPLPGERPPPSSPPTSRRRRRRRRRRFLLNSRCAQYSLALRPPPPLHVPKRWCLLLRRRCSTRRTACWTWASSPRSAASSSRRT